VLARVLHGLLREQTSQTFLELRNPVRKTVEVVLVALPVPQMFCDGHEIADKYSYSRVAY